MTIKDLFTILEVDEKTQLYISVTVSQKKPSVHNGRLFSYSQFLDKLLDYPELNSYEIEKLVYSQSVTRDENNQRLNLLLVDAGEDEFLYALK